MAENPRKSLMELYDKYLSDEILFEFYGDYAFAVKKGQILPLSKKFFYCVGKNGVPFSVVEQMVLLTLSSYFNDNIDKETLIRAENAPHVKELPLEEIFDEETIKIVKKRKRAPLKLYQKVKEKFGPEPFVKDYAKDYYRWKNGELRLFPFEEADNEY